MKRPTDIQRAVGCLGTAIIAPGLLPVAALAKQFAALQERQRTDPSRTVRVLAALLAGCIFLFFCLTLVLALPYYLLIQFLGRLQLIQLETPPSLHLQPRTKSAGVDVLRSDLTVAHARGQWAFVVVERIVHDVVNASQPPIRLYRVARGFPPRVTGPIHVDTPTASERAARMVAELEYGDHADFWLVCGGVAGAEEDRILPLLDKQLGGWSEEVEAAPIAEGGAHAYMRISVMREQGSLSATLLICGSAEAVRAAENAAMAAPDLVPGLEVILDW